MSTIATGIADQPAATIHVLPSTAFHRLTEAEFGTPGLVAIESVGPFVQLAKLGPFITIHDSFIDPGLGIGHHPHRGNERLFYILRGELRHDDALNHIQGEMGEGDLARLTEGERGMLHQEWNGRDDITTHAFILVYTPDVEPPIERASFAALRSADMARIEEAQGVETLQLIGGASTFRASSSVLTRYFDSTLRSQGVALDHDMPPREGLIVYPLEGTVKITDERTEPVVLSASGPAHPEGPDAMAVAWSDSNARTIHIGSVDGPARLLRIGFARGERDVVIHRPWSRP